jgi:Icc-related predicted phosphoesterase
MRIMAVSDRILETLYASDVGSRYSDLDLIIGCGDLPYYYLEFLTSALNTDLLYVRGNHDIGPQYTADGRVLTGVPGGVDIHGRFVKKKGLLIAGLEGSMRYRPQAPYMYSEREMSLMVTRMVPSLLWNLARHGRGIDILVTHSPPFEIHDGRDIAHRGFKIFRTLMSYFPPKYLLHGHVHVYRQDVPRETRFRDTMVINVYPFRLIDIDFDIQGDK